MTPLHYDNLPPGVRQEDLDNTRGYRKSRVHLTEKQKIELAGKLENLQKASINSYNGKTKHNE